VSKKQKKEKVAETVQEQAVAVAEKVQEERIPKLRCQHCQYRNNNEKDRRDTQGSSGWCSRHNKYVARKNWACENIKERKIRKQTLKETENELLEETAEESRSGKKPQAKEGTHAS